MDLPEDQSSAQAKVSYHRFKVSQSGMDLENIFIMSEVSQSKKEKYHNNRPWDLQMRNHSNLQLRNPQN